MDLVVSVTVVVSSFLPHEGNIIEEAQNAASKMKVNSFAFMYCSLKLIKSPLIYLLMQ